MHAYLLICTRYTGAIKLESYCARNFTGFEFFPCMVSHATNVQWYSYYGVIVLATSLADFTLVPCVLEPRYPVLCQLEAPKMESQSASSRALDPASSHAKADATSRNAISCLYCGKKIGGDGITRFKYHLAGIPGQVESCKKVPNDVKRHTCQASYETSS